MPPSTKSSARRDCTPSWSRAGSAAVCIRWRITASAPDDDLYIPDGEFLACHEALLENGLTTDTPENELATADEVSYTKKGSPLYIELHRRLFDSAEDAHDDLNRFFAAIDPVEADGFLAMPPHEHLLYLILHAYKHFVGCGIGLRQFCDIGLWAQAYHDQIDWQRVHAQCERVHAATFARAAFRIARDGWASRLPCLRRGMSPSTPNPCCTIRSAAACTARTTTRGCIPPP